MSSTEGHVGVPREPDAHLKTRSAPLAHDLLRLLDHKLHSIQTLLGRHIRASTGGGAGPVFRQRGEAKVEAGERTDPVCDSVGFFRT